MKRRDETAVAEHSASLGRELGLSGKMGFGALGVGKQEAFQLLWNASAIFYALTYLVMFAIPLAGFKGVQQAPSGSRRCPAS